MVILNHPLTWALAPFYLNDFGFALLQSYPTPFFLFDYACRLWALGILAWRTYKQGHFTHADLRLQLSRRWVVWAVAATLWGLLIDQKVAPAIGAYLPHLKLFHFPKPDSFGLKFFDQSVGLALVAFSEELAFRGALLNWFEKTGMPRVRAISLQALLFGLIHWGGGPEQVVDAILWCIVPSVATVASRSLVPAIVAHFITDFVSFW